MNELEHLPFFVYGTLKRGERNQSVWPHRPRQVLLATTRGELYDLGPYPAMGRGNDIVSGELWFIESEHLPATIKALDQLEGYNQGGRDLYERAIVECWLANVKDEASPESTQAETAYTYFYLEPIPNADQRRVVADESGTCSWPK